MNKQEQKRKLHQTICGSCDGCTLCSCPQINRILEAGYINGADFVAYLKIAEIPDKDYPHLAIALFFDDTREELTDFIDKVLQEYLKGE